MSLILIDSWGWIEYFGNGPAAAKYAPLIERATPETVVTPTVVLYEVHKHASRIFDFETVGWAIGQIKARTQIVGLDEATALEASEASKDFKLPMADAFIYATAQQLRATLVTGDAHFAKLPGVKIVR